MRISLLIFLIAFSFISKSFSQQKAKSFLIKHPSKKTDVKIGFYEHLPDPNSNHPPLPFVQPFPKRQELNLKVSSKTSNNGIKPYSTNFLYGSNMGYYGSNRSDVEIAQLVSNVGGNTIRPALPHSFLTQYGYNIRLNTFKDYREKLKLKDITVFVEDPSDAVRDKTKYEGSLIESKVFKNLYEPIWNTDSTINKNNPYAIYIYETAIRYGPYVKFWEVFNEPDFTTSLANRDEWLKRAPKAFELANLQAPFYYYIRMLRITYEVLKKYSPDAYVATGGIGYTNFLSALLRYSDNPDGGKISPEYPNTGGAYFDVLSFHYYPNYKLRTWDSSNKDFSYFRHSDSAADKVIEEKNKFKKVLSDFGYDNITYPEKIFIMTETGIARKTFETRYGSNEMQRNFVIKTLIQSQKNNIKQIYFYTLGERADLNDNVNTNEFKLMGFYENLLRDKSGNEKFTDAGVAHKTTSSLLFGFKYDSLKTRNLNLPINVEGAAFVNNDEVRYILWAKTNTDKSETININYTFPLNVSNGLFNRYEWDYSKTNKFITIVPSVINLTGSPSIFIKSNSDIPTP